MCVHETFDVRKSRVSQTEGEGMSGVGHGRVGIPRAHRRQHTCVRTFIELIAPATRRRQHGMVVPGTAYVNEREKHLGVGRGMKTEFE